MPLNNRLSPPPATLPRNHKFKSVAIYSTFIKLDKYPSIMRNCVIHRGCVIAEFRIKENTKQDRNKALAAHSAIEYIIESDPRVVLLDTEDAETVVDFFEPGEEVTLYGAYLDGCLDIAYEALESKGVKPRYHPTGCIPLFP